MKCARNWHDFFYSASVRDVHPTRLENTPMTNTLNVRNYNVVIDAPAEALFEVDVG